MKRELVAASGCVLLFFLLITGEELTWLKIFLNFNSLWYYFSDEIKQRIGLKARQWTCFQSIAGARLGLMDMRNKSSAIWILHLNAVNRLHAWFLLLLIAGRLETWFDWLYPTIRGITTFRKWAYLWIVPSKQNARSVLLIQRRFTKCHGRRSCLGKEHVNVHVGLVVGNRQQVGNYMSYRQLVYSCLFLLEIYPEEIEIFSATNCRNGLAAKRIASDNTRPSTFCLPAMAYRGSVRKHSLHTQPP